MPVTQIAGKPGVYRHIATQFIVHEVFNLEQILKSNGVLVEWDTGAWAWKAGRDLKDMLYHNVCNSLQSVCDAMVEQRNGLGSYVVSNPTAQDYIAFPMLLDVQALNGSPITRNAAKIFAIITNVHAGRGHNLLGEEAASKWVGRYPFDYVMSSGWVAGGDTKHGYTIANARTGAGYNLRGVPTQHASDAGSLLGTAVVAMPLGMTWEAFAVSLISNLEHGDRAEVKSKCHEKMDPFIPLLKAAAPLPMVYIPVEITTTGVYIVDPSPARRAVLSTHEANTTNLKTVKVMPMRGGVAFDKNGYSQTSDLWLCPAKKGSGALDWAFQIGDPTGATITGSLDATAAIPLQGVNSSLVRTIDGIRLERVLGGLGGQFLSDTGEQAVSGSIPNVTSASLVAKWRDAIYTAGINTSVLGQQTVAGTGLPESNEVWQARVESYSGPGEFAAATQLTNWDMHGISGAVGMLLLLASLDGDKTDASWVTAIWPARRRVQPAWMANALGGGPTKIASAVPATGGLV